MQKFTCPNCNANLVIDDKDRDFAFCQYCGTKIMLDDYRMTKRIVNEARIKESEDEKIVRLKELEIEEKKQLAKEKTKSNKTSASVLLAVIGAFMIIIGVFSDNPDSDWLSIMGMLVAFLSLAFLN